MGGSDITIAAPTGGVGRLDPVALGGDIAGGDMLGGVAPAGGTFEAVASGLITKSEGFLLSVAAGGVVVLGVKSKAIAGAAVATGGVGGAPSPGGSIGIEARDVAEAPGLFCSTAADEGGDMLSFFLSEPSAPSANAPPAAATGTIGGFTPFPAEGAVVGAAVCTTLLAVVVGAGGVVMTGAPGKAVSNAGGLLTGAGGTAVFAATAVPPLAPVPG